ncbi:MAG: sulfurtransferase [Saprospirales bacterium]|jgi:thiosulfate/3-mercaptopyruvate sulfurtransferase|nr:sulfurtransferase [Saprospirales bacterium]
MKTYSMLSFVIGLVLMAIMGATAQADLITAKDFMVRMKENPDLAIIDAGKVKTYATSHVKGAVHINHMDLYQKGNPIEGLILASEDLAAFFGSKGISEKSEIVIYDEGSQKYNTRIYWILKYLGAENVKMLHMNMDEWAKVRLPLVSTATEIKPVTFTPSLNPAVYADIEEVKQSIGNPAVVLIDARTEAEYKGTTEDSQGHIPGAILIDHKTFLTDTGAFRPEEEIRKIAEDLGITPDMEIITYCKTSVRAAPVFVAFKNILGYEKVKVYDGAYNEWVVENPVVQ